MMRAQPRPTHRNDGRDAVQKSTVLLVLLQALLTTPVAAAAAMQPLVLDTSRFEGQPWARELARGSSAARSAANLLQQGGDVGPRVQTAMEEWLTSDSAEVGRWVWHADTNSSVVACALVGAEEPVLLSVLFLPKENRMLFATADGGAFSFNTDDEDGGSDDLVCAGGACHRCSFDGSTRAGRQGWGGTPADPGRKGLQTVSVTT